MKENVFRHPFPIIGCTKPPLSVGFTIFEKIEIPTVRPAMLSREQNAIKREQTCNLTFGGVLRIQALI